MTTKVFNGGEGKCLVVSPSFEADNLVDCTVPQFRSPGSYGYKSAFKYELNALKPWASEE
jgi:hypothetical protein